MDFSTLARKFRCYRDYYFIYDKRFPFVVALMFGRYLIETAFLNVIMWYLSYYGLHLVKSAILSNIIDSLSSFLVICMMIMADSCVGRFRALVFSNTAYVSGLLLLWLFNPYNTEWLIMVALVLLALGASGCYLLEVITFDLMDDIDTTKDRNTERSLARAEMLSGIAKVFGAICTTLWVAPDALGGVFPTWKFTLCVCIITMTVCSVIFFIGYNFFHQDWLTERPDWIGLRVLGARFQKLLTCNSWYLIHTSRQQRLPQNMENEVIPQESSLHLNRTGQENRGDEHRVIWKSLLRMVPMWVTYLVVSAVSASGRTFFFEQFSNLNAVNKIPIQIYDLVKKISSFGIPYVYRLFSCSHKNHKVKIGVGMLCALICCVFAWQLEVHRLEVVQHQGDRDANTSLSFLWLVPQFCVLGCMEGLTWEGLLEFYKSHITDERLKSYGEDYSEFVMGTGKLIHIFLILIIQSQTGWFGNTINDSRLDKYYVILVCFCSGNFIIYCCISLWFYKHTEQIQGQANGDSQQNQQLLAISDSQQDYPHLPIVELQQDNNLLPNRDPQQDHTIMPNDDFQHDHRLLVKDDSQQDHRLVVKIDSQQDHRLVVGNDSQLDHPLVPVIDDSQQDHRLMVRDESQVDHPLVTVKDDSQQDHGLVDRDEPQVDHPLVTVKDDSQQGYGLVVRDESQVDHPLVTVQDDSQQDHRLVVRDESQVDHPLVRVQDDSQQDHRLVVRDESQVDHPLVPVKDDSQQDHQSLSDEESQQDHLSFYVSSKTNGAEQNPDHIM